MRRLAAAVFAVLLATPGAAPAPADPDAALRFVRDGVEVKRVDLATLRRACPVETVEIDDPYYEARKSFLACPLRAVLELGLGDPGTLAGADVLLRARDGYVKPARGERLLEDGGYVAFADASRNGRDGSPWEPIGRQQVDPGPFYLVWAKSHQRDPHTYPWPYQLETIEVTDLARTFPHIVPRTAPPGSPAWEGFAVFRTECVACHSVNGEGGKVGPDLNVPQSIVEYRPAAQVKSYIRNPAAFRYTTMPSHEHLSPAQLDALVAYFETMKTLKHDPGRAR